jgi:hypothetical protein
MVQAIEDVAIDEPLRTELVAFFDRSSAYVVNHGEKPALSKAQSGTPGNNTRAEISRR